MNCRKKMQLYTELLAVSMKSHERRTPDITRSLLLLIMSEPRYFSFLEALAVVIAVVLLVELFFYLIVRFHLVPRANIRLPPAPYRDYPGGQGQGQQRHLLLLRILDRVEQYARFKNKPIKGAIANKILGWFQRQEEEQVPATFCCELEKSLTNTNQDGDEAADSPTVSPPCSPIRADIENSPRTITAAAASVSRRLRYRRGQQSSRGGPDDILCDQNDNDAQGGGAENKGSGELGMEDVILHSDGTWTIKGLGLMVVRKLFAWVLFSKDIDDLEGWEKDELDQAFRIIGQERLGLVFHDDSNHQQQHEHDQDDRMTVAAPSKKQQRLRPLRMSLEDVQISHKPLTIYILVYMIKFGTSAILRCSGFRRIVTRSGLVAWFRPSQQKKKQDDDEQEPILPQLQPLLFFHGVSPAPLTICLPMILNGLAADRRRAVVLFENPTISWSLGFYALSEQDTLDGVQQVVHEYLDTNTNSSNEKQQRLAIAGHSFGSCCVTWLIRSPTLRNRVGQIILLDPVTILLSEPSVVVNFLYANHRRARLDLLEIVSSELFTQYYIRRHFSWYNSELWMPDVPSDIPITIALSGKDDIVDAPAVREHVLQFQHEHGGRDRRGAIELLYWPNLPHAMCVAFPDKWAQVEQAMLQQELLSVSSQPTRRINPDVSSMNAC
jgi:hypothetical protein